MKKNMKWIIAAIAVVVLVVLAVVLFGNGSKDQQVSGNAPAVPTMEATVAADATQQPVADATAEPAADVTAEPAADATAATADPKTVMITVNGADILLEDVELITTNLVSTYAQYGYDTTDETFLNDMKQYALEYAVQLELMEQKAAEKGFDQFTDEEKATIEAENATNWAEIVDLYVTYYGGVTEESTEEEKAAARVNVLSMLEGMGFTEAIMLEDAFNSAKLDRVEAFMLEGAAVTDDEVKALFDEYVKQDEASYKEDIGMYEYMTQYYGQESYYTPEGYRGITHILLEVDEELLSTYQTLSAQLEEKEDAIEAATTTDITVTQADVDAAYQAIIASVQPTIDEINQKLAEGVSFAELVATYGTDPGMEQEPAKSEGYPVHMDSIIWDPAFVQAAFSVDKVGDVAQPVVGSYGVHIVQYTRDVPAGPVEYTADIQLALHEAALSQKENEQFNATMEAWMAEAQVTYSAEAQAMLGIAE